MNLQEDIEKLTKELKRTLDGNDNYELVKQLSLSLEKTHKEYAFSDEKNRIQEEYDFFNLCHEISKIYIGKNIDSEIKLVLIILSSAIGKMFESKEYKELLQRKCYFEEAYKYTCRLCKKSFPVFVSNGFSDNINAYCSKCGNILLICKYDEIFSNTSYQEVEEKLPKCSCGHKSFKFSFGEQAPFGVKIDKYCIYCNSVDLEYEEISAYEYFHNKKYFYFEDKKLVTVEEHEKRIGKYTKKNSLN